jgi:hypothetical protein
MAGKAKSAGIAYCQQSSRRLAYDPTRRTPKHPLHAGSDPDKESTAMPGYKPFKLILASLLGATVVSLAACGGGGGGGGGSASTAAGTFTDDATMGLTYSASPSGTSGTTSETGGFNYRPGDTVTFSLPLGNGQSLALGSYAPKGDSASVTVLSLPNAMIVAQILQSLDHSSSSDHMDVSGLIIPAADIANLKTYLASAGQTLPAGKTDLQMLSGIQMDASGGLPFRHMGGVSTLAAFTAARQAADQAVAANPLDAGSGTLLDGEFVLFTGYSNYGPQAFIARLDTSGTSYAVSAVSDAYGNIEYSIGFDGAGSYINVAGSTYTLSGDAESGITSYSGYGSLLGMQPLVGAGNYRVLPANPIDLVGKLVSVDKLQDCHGGPATEAVFDDGQQDGGYKWSLYCGQQADVLAVANPVPVASGTGFQVNNMPVMRQLTSCNRTQFIAIEDGGLSAGSSVVLLTGPYAPSIPSAGYMETAHITAVGSPPTSLNKVAPTCASYAGTPIQDFFPGLKISGTFSSSVWNSVFVTIDINGTEYTSTQANRFPNSTSGSFQLSGLPDTGDFTIATPTTSCTITNGTGTLTGTNIGNVSIQC